MAKKTVKCCECGEEHNIEDMYRKGKSKYYCENCVDPDYRDWCDLFEYTKKILHTDKLSNMIITQFKNYVKDKEVPMTYEGMRLTLKYIVEYEGKELKAEEGMGLIPFYYDKAATFYNKAYEIEDKVDDYNFEQESFKVIKVKPYLDKNKKSRLKPISLELWKDREDSEE